MPEGALSDARNCVMRDIGTIEAAPSSSDFTLITPSPTNDQVRLLMPLDAGHVFSFTETSGGVWSVCEGVPGGTQNAAPLPSGVSTTGLFPRTRVNATRSRDRMLVNSTRGAVVGDNMAPTNGTQRTLRWAGLPQAGSPAVVLTAGTIIPLNIMVAYVAVLVREFSDGYRLVGTPSPPQKAVPIVSNCIATLYCALNVGSGHVVAGDYIEVYRTDGLSTTSVNADPGDTFKLIGRKQLTSGDIAANEAVIVDSQQLISPYYTTSGRELYTNPGQEGSLAANRQPDVCGAIATWRGYTFYGNITERAQWLMSVPGGINHKTLMATDANRRAAGVGSRSIAGTTVIGNPTITGVSAADMVGIKPGQYWVDGLSTFPMGSVVVSTTATTITMNANATLAGALPASAELQDIIEINGNPFRIPDASTLMFFVSRFASGIELTTNQTVGSNANADSSGLTIVFENAHVYGQSPSGTQNLTVRGTNGANYSPPIPEYNQTVQTFTPITTPNLYRWSKDSEPEAVPSANEGLAGSADIVAFTPTKDALWITCTDGALRLSGDTAPWRLDVVAPQCVPCSPKSIVNLRDVPYANTNLGFGALTPAGFVPISNDVLKQQFPGQPFSETDASFFVGKNESDGEVLIYQGTLDAEKVYVYNAITNAFTYLAYTTAHFQNFTCFAWQDYTADGSPSCTLFGVSEVGSDPAYFRWKSSFASANHLPMQVQYLPLYLKEPMRSKQWIDMTFVFSRAAAGVGYTVYGIVAGDTFTQSPGVPILARGGTEAYATVGIPRRYAIDTKITPGLFSSNTGSARVVLYGISLRYVALTAQQEQRG